MRGWSREDRLESRTGVEMQSGKGWELPEAKGRPRLSLEAVRELVGVVDRAVCGE